MIAALFAHAAFAALVGKNCGGYTILANETSGVNVTIDRKLFSKVNCNMARDLAERMPELAIIFDDLEMATGVDQYNLENVQNAVFASMLNNLKEHDNTLEIFRMPGMEGLSEHLLPIDEATVNISEKYLMRNKAGEVVAYSEQPRQYVVYYNINLFEDQNVTIPLNATSWEEWEEALLLVQKKHRAYLRQCCEEDGGKCFCGDPDDFHALAIEHFQQVTQQERWLRSSYATNFFAMLLSGGTSGSTIMDNDGNVTVNSPQAVKTLEMWRRWYATIVHPSQDSHPTKWVNKRVAALIDFNDIADDLTYFRTPIAMAPIPGPKATGAPDNVWVGISKYVRHPEAALEVMKLITPYQERVQVLTAGPPVDSRVVNGTSLYESWCDNWSSRKSLTCASYEKNPAYWQRPFVSLGHLCGESKLSCTAIVYDYITQSLRGQILPEVALEQMAGDLQNTLVRPVRGNGDDLWTAEFTFLVVVAVVGSIAFFALMFLAWSLVRPLRSSGTLVVPLPVMLSVCMMLIMGVEIGVATDYSSSTSRDISKSLALKLRTETLASIENAVVPQLENAAGVIEPRKGKLARLRAGLAVTIGLLKLDEGALVAVVDRDDGKVLGSSDSWMQRIDATLAEDSEVKSTRRTASVLQEAEDQTEILTVPLSSWLAEVPVAVPTWNNVTKEDLLESYSTSVEGETVLFSMMPVEYKGLDLLVVYFVPEEVILGKANDDVDKLIYMSAGLAVLAVVAVAGVAVVSTLPLVTLSRDMEAVRVMRVEDVMSGKGSRLAEMNALLLGFHGMVEMLVEYKSYMPKTLFMKEDESDEIETASERKSDTKSSTSRSRASLSTPSVQESVGYGPQLDKLNASEGCVVRVRVVGLHEMLEKTTRASNMFMDLLSAAEQVSETYRACLHTFSAVEPGDFVLSWGVISGGIPHRERAARAALHLAEGRSFVLGVTLLAGPCRSGNMGTSKTRGFGIVGRVMEECGRMSRTSLEMAGALGKSVVLCNEGAQRKLINELQVELVDLLGGLHSTLRRVFRVLRIREMDCQEWMYELEEQQKAAKHPVTLCLEEVSKGRDLGAAATVLGEVRLGEDAFGLNHLIAQRLLTVKDLKLDAEAMCSLFSETLLLTRVKSDSTANPPTV